MACLTGLAAILLTLCGLNVPASAAQAPSAEEAAKIAAAVPDKPTVSPQKPRKLLVFSLAPGYTHSSIPYGKKALEIMASKTAAFEAIISDDISIFEPQNLNRFDAVFFNNTNNELFIPDDFQDLPAAEQARIRSRDETLKKSLADFISSGKGLAVIHAGVASFRQWPEYGNIIGARFDNHPWNEGSTVTLKLNDPNHPLARAFKQPTFTVTDEIYQFASPYSRTSLRVLLSIDAAKTNTNIPGIHRTDSDFAISWVKNYGKGRVFYCALGHQHDIFSNPAVLQHLLDGIQFATGDLTADAAPSTSLPTAPRPGKPAPSPAPQKGDLP
jgi:hypothetical protein